MILIFFLFLSLCLLLAQKKEEAALAAVSSILVTFIVATFLLNKTSQISTSKNIERMSLAPLHCLNVLHRNGDALEKVIVDADHAQFLIKKDNSPDVLETTTTKYESTRFWFPFIMSREDESYKIYLSTEQAILFNLYK